MQHILPTSYTHSFDPAPFGYDYLKGLTSGSLAFDVYRLLTGITTCIDLTGTHYSPKNRDWCPEVPGAHWTTDAVSPCSEVGVHPSELTTGAFMLHASGHMRYIDERYAGDAAYSGLRFHEDVRFSQRITIQNLGFLQSGGFDCFIRKRRAALSDEVIGSTVVGIFPWAYSKLKLVEVAGYGHPPSNPIIVLPDGARVDASSFVFQA